jgi:hypothetical protein
VAGLKPGRYEKSKGKIEVEKRKRKAPAADGGP